MPILLFLHGVSRTGRSTDAETIPQDFSMPRARGHVRKEGYQSIGPEDLVSRHLEGAHGVPPEPVPNAFDDAHRADSFMYADPILRDAGFKATM